MHACFSPKPLPSRPAHNWPEAFTRRGAGGFTGSRRSGRFPGFPWSGRWAASGPARGSRARPCRGSWGSPPSCPRAVCCGTGPPQRVHGLLRHQFAAFFLKISASPLHSLQDQTSRCSPSFSLWVHWGGSGPQGTARKGSGGWSSTYMAMSAASCECSSKISFSLTCRSDCGANSAGLGK